MDVISSAEFRIRYAKLIAPTLVTVNGHPLGTWTPAAAQIPEPTIRQMSQVERDDLLRKINRGRSA
jgi:hypothetical protein